MSTVLAVVRPDEWNLPLFVHVLGAMIVVGGLAAGTSALAFAHRDTAMLRLGYWSLLAVTLPGWIMMRVGAQWTYSEEGLEDFYETVDEPTWLGIGWIVGDLGGIVLLLSLIIGGVGVYRLRAGKGAGLLKVTLVLALLLLAACLIAAWAMSGKPD